MFLEFNWTANVWQPRLGDVFTAVNGWRSFPDLATADFELAIVGLRRGRKTDSRTYELVMVEAGE